MANLALAAAGVPPVWINIAPCSTSAAYPADPGTLTEWLVANTADLGRDAVLAVLTVMNAKYVNAVDPSSPKSDSMRCSGSWRSVIPKDWNPFLP